MSAAPGDFGPEINPFLDPGRVRGDLYSDGARLATRSGALMRAKTSGRHVPDVVVDLATRHWAQRGESNNMSRTSTRRILDVGCGRGSSSLTLHEAFPDAHVIMLDLSQELLRTTRARVASAGWPAACARADFHRLPVRSESIDLVLAAFCLYHSRSPVTVIGEFARCLRPGGAAILVTKSKDSYRELDRFVARSGLDTLAGTRRSLYETAHSGNMEALAASALHVVQVIHERHTFRFDDLGHLADYISTTPKYTLPPHVSGQRDQIAEALGRLMPAAPVNTSSTVTYVMATRSAATERPEEGAQ